MNKTNLGIALGTLIVVGLIIGVYFGVMRLSGSGGEREITDGLGRDVSIPDEPMRIIGVNPGSLRLLCYLGLADKVVGVESIENTSAVRPYNFAYPELANLPIIGPQFGGDPELIAAAAPDVIFATYMEKGDADTLQTQTGIPVVVLNYGDLLYNREYFYDSLKLIGEIMNVQERAEQLIAYINNTIDDLQNRTAAIPESGRISAYIGGIGYHGAHGLSSTEPHYPPLEFINADNSASELELDHAFVDDEQVIQWNPYYLFIDGGGLGLAIEDIKNGSAFWNTLDAVRENRTYVVLPYNWYTTNMETVLVDAYYIGSIIYPEYFADIDFQAKASEIYMQFLGADIYSEMVNEYGGCYHLDTSAI